MHPAMERGNTAVEPRPATGAGKGEDRQGQRRRAEQMAERAVGRFGLEGARVALLAHKTNVTFRIDAQRARPGDHPPGMEPGRFLLRLCHAGAYDRREIASELDWLEALQREEGLVVPQAVAADDGERVPCVRSEEGTEERFCVLFHWVKGEVLESPRPDLMEQVGELAARIHRCSERFTPPDGFRRPKWTWDSLFGTSTVVPEGVGEPFVTDRVRGILDEGAGAVREAVAPLGEGRDVFGLIHKDLEPDNTVVDGGRVRAIDFADCGWGYYLYDLAAALLPLRERKGYAELRDAFLRGYQAVRPLRREHIELLDTFLIARCLFSIRFMALHSLDRPEVRRYARRVIPLMVGEIRRYLGAVSGARTGGGSDGDPAGWTTLQLLSHLRRAGVELWAEGERLRFRSPKGALTPVVRDELARRKEEVLTFLRQSARQAASGLREPVIRRSDEPSAPLSFAQQRLWFLDRLRPGSADYNVSRGVLLRGDLSLPILARCVHEIVRRHAVLRTTFNERDGVAVQEIAPSLRLPLPVLDLRGLPRAARDREVRAVARREGARPFDLRRGPLLRLPILQLDPGRHVVLSTMHHIVSDAWSTGVLFREIGELYRAFSEGRPSPLPELPIQYADFARWQRRYLSGQVLEEQLHYWRQELAGAPEESPLPLDRPRSSSEAARGGRLEFRIPPDVLERLAGLAREQGATLFMVALAGFQLLLHRYSGERDVVVGSPIANRNRSDIEGLIGFFVNTLVFRSRLDGAPSFCELLGELQRRTVRAFEHQDVPFELLVEELRPTRRLDRNPLFQVLFMLQSGGRQGFSVPGLEASFLPSGATVAKFDLTVSLQESDGGLVGALRYRSDLLDPTTVGRLAESYRVLLDAVGRDSEVHALRAPLLPRALGHQLLREWNDTRTAGGARPVPEVVADRARRSPDAIAVAAGDGCLSYGELERRSRGWASVLNDLGVGREDLVALYLERSEELVVATLAVLEAGAGYLVLEPGGPPWRLRRILSDARPAVILTREELEADLEGSGGTVVRMESEALRRALEPSRAPAPVERSALAYAVYTSGSTGTPKGVLVHHGALANHMAWIDRVYPIAAGDSVLHKTSFTFDPSVGELWAPLMAGARLVLAPAETQRDPARLADWLVRERSATLQVVPSLLRELVAEPGLRAWASPRRVYCGGEVLAPELLERTLRTVSAPVCNVYGPAEAAIHATAWTCEEPEGRASVPVGRPIDNVRVVLLDAALELAPVGSTGELWIGGLGVARGYLGRPAASAGAFLPDLFGRRPGDRMYRSGDLGRQRPDGTIEFVGRRDHQVKIRGVRIEPGEVEAALVEHPWVREAAVQARVETRIEEGRGGDRSCELVAYVVSVPGERLAVRELRSHLEGRLPTAAIPTAFVPLEALPRTAGGKVDRRALPPVEGERSLDGESFAPPATPTEEILAGVWEEVLDAESVGVRDDFFELGGHSLLAVQVASRVRALFGVELALRTLFEAPTVRELATLVDAGRRESSGRAVPPPEPVPRDRELPLSYAQERLWFLDQLEPGLPAYNLPGAVDLEGPVRLDRLARVFREVVRRHEAFRTRFELRGGRPTQRIVRPGPVPVPTVDLGGLPRSVRRAEARRLSRREAGRSFDLERDALFRVLLLRSNPEEHRVLVTMHHIVSDGWSMGIFLRELAELYGAFSRDLPSPLQEPPLQYADYAHWQRTWLTGEALVEELGFWRERLEGAPARLDLPTDRPRPPVQTFRGGTRAVRLDPALGARVRSFARAEGATPFMVLLAVFQALLGRLARQEDVSTGSPVAGRSHAELEGVVGFFVNTLVFRSAWSGRPGFRELVARVREEALEAYAHQELPFERLVEELAPERDLSQHPLFQVMFALQNAPRRAFEVPGLRLTPVSVSGGTSKFDLSLVLQETDGAFTGAFEYSADLFDDTSVARFGRQLEGLLRRALAEPDHPVLEHPWLDAAELQQVLVEWNETLERTDSAGWVHRRVEVRARRAPDSTALRAGARTVTYGALDERAARLAGRLAAFGLGPDTVAAVFLERSIDEVVALLAVLKAGGAYLPLDPELPPDRLAFMLEDSGARVVITSSALDERLPDLGTPRLRVDEIGGPAADPEVEGAEPPVHGGQLAYLIYTSGSTGRPKGVQLHHDGLLNLIRWHHRAFGVTDRDRATRLSGLAFDASVWELWPYLASGATVLIPADETRRDPDALKAWLVAEGATSAFVPTPMAEELVAVEWPGTVALRTLLTGGDRLHGHPRSPLPFDLVNNYGPTENTVVATSGTVPVRPEGRGAPTLGRPIDGVRIYVLDRGGLVVPTGVPGELHVGGSGVGRGYLGRPALTAERFVPSPFRTGPGARLYATGDLARWCPGGELEFLGRIDQQVQLRGFRIEPEEIEAVLEGHPAVRESLVLLRRDGSHPDRLVAYLVAERGVDPGIGDLREHLGRSLPEYMVPAAFVALESFPLTANGKIDREALPEPGDSEGTAGPGGGTATPTEELLAAVWTEVLGHESVGLEDDFFQAGGHSLLATQVVSRIRDLLDVELGVRDVFERPTVRALAGRVDERRRESVGSPPPLARLARLAAPAEVPLSFAQERLWFLAQFSGARAAYNIPLVLDLRGELDVPALARAVGEVVRRHGSLRTAFETREGRPQAAVRLFCGVAVPLVDLVGLPPERSRAEAHRLASREARTPFDLAAPPLLRAGLLRLADREHVALITMHHIASDGWSVSVFTREAATLYESFRRGEPSPLEALPVQYGDYALWQRRWLSGPVLDAHLAFWKERLAGAPPTSGLPTDRPRPAVQSFRGGSRGFVLPEGLTERLRALARQRGVTLFMLLLAAFKTLLHRHSGAHDLVVGSPVAGRTRTEVEGLIGFFANTLVLRTQIGPGERFPALLERVREAALGAYAHQELPFERLVEEVHGARDLSRNPLFQVAFALQNAPAPAETAGGLEWRSLGVDHGMAKFDLTLSLQERAGRLHGSLEFSRDLFDPSTIVRTAGHLERCLQGVVETPEARLEDLSLLSRAERQQLIEWNPGPAARVSRGSAVELFLCRLREQPDAAAIDGPDGTLTYGELGRRSERLARRLRGRGLRPGEVVGVCARRSADEVLAALGVLRAGSAYVPLDPTQPPERLRWMLDDAGAALVVGHRELTGPVAGDGVQAVELQGSRPELTPVEARESLPTPGARDLAYVIYTSGSTGRPKGVEVEHGSLGHLIRWHRRAFGLEPGDRSPHLASQGFDASVWEIWPPLALGATLLLPDEEPGRTSPGDLRDWLLGARASVSFLPTPLAEEVLALDWPETAPLRWLLTGGDRLHRGPRRSAPFGLVNNYGPTENTVVASSGVVEPQEPGTGTPSIGRPVDHTRVSVLDRSSARVPQGVPGELCLAGPGLARGYLRRPALTAEAFVPDPHAGVPGGRLYRTGDQARWLDRGEIDFLGRLDQQVKVRGYRVEPGEIEAAVASHDGVKECVVTVSSRGSAGELLVCHCVPEEGVGFDPRRLRDRVARRLPDYMVPSEFRVLGALPVTPNGKVDRTALAARALEREDRHRSESPPADALELELVGIWEEVLGVQPVHVRDDFFDLGGHSLLAMRLLARIERRWGRPLAIETLFRAPTVADLAAELRSDPMSRRSTSPLVLIRHGGEGRPLFCVHPVSGSVLCYAELARHLGRERSVYGLQSGAHDDGSRGRTASLEDMAARYVDEVRAADPEGPSHLLGWSMGGVIALEMARQMVAQEHPVGLVALVDAQPPEDRHHRPLPTEAERIGLFLRDLVALHGHTPPGDPEDFESATAEEAWTRAGELLEGLGPPFDTFGLEELRRRFAGFDRNLRAFRGYRPRPFPGRVVLFSARESPEPGPTGLRERWRRLVGDGLEVEEVPGGHYSVLRDDHLKRWIGRLRARLQAAETGGGEIG